MTNCILCSKKIPPNRYKYCSKPCIKRAYYLRKKPSTKSFFVKNSGFWSTETGIGLKWEKFANKILKGEHLMFNVGGPDLIVNGKRVDVKSSSLYKRKNKRGKSVVGKQFGVWRFKRGTDDVDYFFCICLLNNLPYKILYIPSKDFPKNGIMVGKNSIYDKFIYNLPASL